MAARATEKFEAKHSSVRSGYASDIFPGTSDNPATGIAVPRATASGLQQGVIPPHKRKYKRNIGTVSLSEALSRAKARRTGELSPLSPEPDAPALNIPEKQVPSTIKAAASEYFNHSQPVTREEVSIKEVVVEKELDEASQNALDYLNKRTKVSLELLGGTIVVNIVDVCIAEYGILLIGSANSDTGTFIPSPGTDVTIVTEDGSKYKCYFPGAYYTLAGLNLLVLPFVTTGD